MIRITTVSYPPPLQHPGLDENLDPLLLRRFQHMKGMVAFLQTGDEADDVARLNFRQKIQDYGCFCYPGTSEQVRYSPGVPVDEIDNTCRRLHRRWHGWLGKILRKHFFGIWVRPLGRKTNFENPDFLNENVPNWPTTGAGAAVLHSSHVSQFFQPFPVPRKRLQK